MRLLVTLAAIEPGAPLDAAARIADALDARRVPLTLLTGPRPHPEVAAWVRARRRVGDTVLLHGTGHAGRGASFRRLPAHEARLRLTGALRAAEAARVTVDGFAAPGWACSPGTRRALAEAGLTLLVDDDGVHRLGADGAAVTTWFGPVVDGARLPRPGGAGDPGAPSVSGALGVPGVLGGRSGRGGRGGRGGQVAEAARRRLGRGPRAVDVLHLALRAGPASSSGGPAAVVDRALEEGAQPFGAVALAGRPAPVAAAPRDPEHWSMTA